MPVKYQYFDGKKFTRDEKSGYYLNSTIRERMHRYVWKFYNGDIPEGYCVHHIDHDRSNNDISNLTLMKKSDHSTMHGIERDFTSHDEMCKNLIENAVPKSKAWHSSEEGRAWHSKHAKESAETMAEREYVCQYCGKHFFKKPLGDMKFCSNNCKSAARRKSGVDNVLRVCVVCGKPFSTNKYAKTQTCSCGCRNEYRRNVRQEVSPWAF